MSLKEDVDAIAWDVRRLGEIHTRQEQDVCKLTMIEGLLKSLQMRLVWNERVYDELRRDVQAQGTYGERLTELEKTVEKLAKALADLEKDIAKRDADNQAQKDIKKALKQAQDAQKDAMNQFRKMNVDARLTTLEKGVKVAMTLASARR